MIYDGLGVSLEFYFDVDNVLFFFFLIREFVLDFMINVFVFYWGIVCGN